jgi:hypothetical protein
MFHDLPMFRFTITFILCFAIVKPQRVEDIPKRWAKIQLSPPPKPLVLRMPPTWDFTLHRTQLLMILAHLHQHFLSFGGEFLSFAEIFVSIFIYF